ncbi:hypothetical protein Tco_0464269 [Tanacetum coccineum]
MSANKAKKKRPVTGPEQGYPRGSCQAGGSADYKRSTLLALKPGDGRTQALEQETRDLDVENEQKRIKGDDMMLRSFPLTLAGVAKRWLGRTPSEIIKTWDELKQVFIRRFCPPSVTFKKLGEIHNFKQEEGESLYQTWERFNDLLYKCTFHDLNDYQQVNTFYNGLGFYARQFLDSHGLISGLTAVKALESIQEVADDSLDLTP